MNKLLNKSKMAMTSTDLSKILDDIVNIAKVLTSPGKIYHVLFYHFYNFKF